MGHRLPAIAGFLAGETRVSQVPGSSSSYVPQPCTPPARRTLALREYAAVAFRAGEPLGAGLRSFRGWLTAARSLACLRIADVVTAVVARLATDLVGYPVAGRVSHPLDDFSEFRDLPHGSLLSDQPCLVAAPEEPPSRCRRV